MNLPRYLAILFLCIIGAALPSCAPSEPRGPSIFAASSLQAPLDELAENWRTMGNHEPTISYASSTALARQIENGSIADLYISADAQWIDYVVAVGKIDPDSVRTLASNRIVLAAHREKARSGGSGETRDLAGILAGAAVVTGDPDSVPLGRYTQEILIARAAWGGIEPRLIRTASSSAALRIVLLKEADLGFLYASDVERRDDLIGLITFAENLHSPISYKAIRLPSSGHPDAAGFLDYIASAEAAAIFEKYGFSAP